MPNPFEKRATEYFRDDEAFLSVVTPEPLDSFFSKYAQEDVLYDRLVLIIGTPGSGKTTLARLFQYSILDTIVKKIDLDPIKDIAISLTKCKALEDGNIKIVGIRLPLESDYRGFWEFPYPDDLKNGLFFSMIQARAVLGWLRGLEISLGTLDNVRIVSRLGTEAALNQIGGPTAQSVLERGRAIEQAIYDISTDLIPPSIEKLNPIATSPYRPFDVIDYIEYSHDGVFIRLKPLAILDDAHTLHEKQFKALCLWLMRRETKVARWVQTRLDPLKSKEIFSIENELEELKNEPGIQPAREITCIRLQKTDDRKANRETFRKMAKSMSNRYLSRMEAFQRRNLNNFSSLLSSTSPECIAPSKMKELSKYVDSVQRNFKISNKRREKLEQQVKDYIKEDYPDVCMATLAILMSRYAKRTRHQLSLFSSLEDPDPPRPIIVNADIVTGAEIYLMHKYNRPFYYGIDMLCDASTENAEQFLQLASILVTHSETQLIRGKSPTLDARIQHKLLKQKADEIINDWHFPFSKQVYKLTNAMAHECREKTLEPNAPLGSGASAIGILADEFHTIDSRFPELSQVIKYAIAYNVISFIPNYGTKKKDWCLLELNGVLLVHHGLTLKRGGFLERTTSDLNNMLNHG